MFPEYIILSTTKWLYNALTKTKEFVRDHLLPEEHNERFMNRRCKLHSVYDLALPAMHVRSFSFGETFTLKIGGNKSKTFVRVEHFQRKGLWSIQSNVQRERHSYLPQTNNGDLLPTQIFYFFIPHAKTWKQIQHSSTLRKGEAKTVAHFYQRKGVYHANKTTVVLLLLA